MKKLYFLLITCVFYIFISGIITENVYAQDNNFVKLPNAFSPNGDNINDVWVWEAEQIEMFQIHIYDRWGKLIFRSSDIDQGWDGNDMSGNPVALDTYIYYIEGRKAGHGNFLQKGSVLLLR
ncbi:MAG: gliding motility-associated C-terminal domain-containing protein [Chitinophagaceae bacterium]|nr:MAG: gliding motility-associated C-terminal domain-containing protein [Chitinophagaceae bacterium]